MARPARALDDIAAEAIPFAALIAAGEPAILRGVARDWPIVAAARRSTAEAIGSLKRFEGDRPVTAYTGAPEIGGRFFYDATLTGLNFTAARVKLGDVLDRIAAGSGAAAADAPALYIGSTDLDLYLPGFRAENDLPLGPIAAHAPLASIWIGNRTVAAAHYDISNNIACCVAGRRRFTLFPPDQIANLYPGPLEPTPGGQVVSMVDPAAPDLARYPGYRDALAAAVVAELEPGDALIYPALWWHQVEALCDFNILVNYWWNDAPAHADNPQASLLHALLSLRDRPAAEKAAWHALFDYYVFGAGERAGAHLPDQARGALAAPLDPAAARRLRAQILNRLNR
ncbi:cupin-like domain-containing protein [Sphingomonas sanxanigenens]|uniref:JmjC domain-containing protein n=1 Tax=Sphingomonas sanxanigenens DSM 19645 = NX02 TaxID=1123269 RepID=W0AL54_9SPHN|nr:cupin-like domain-containing protein [Sphingomonas sanxanigenens]AHE57317.1 hypothetical protein NX02_28690 [Sphingomonas sanxanigenens DSM 19645 = NX02]